MCVAVFLDILLYFILILALPSFGLQFFFVLFFTVPFFLTWYFYVVIAFISYFNMVNHFKFVFI
jgi:hypothetical protein